MGEQTDESGENMIKIMGYLIPFAPKMVVKLGIFYLRFKGMANKAGVLFKEELLAQGIEEEIAEKLTYEYLKSSHVLQMLRKSG